MLNRVATNNINRSINPLGTSEGKISNVNDEDSICQMRQSGLLGQWICPYCNVGSCKTTRAAM